MALTQEHGAEGLRTHGALDLLRHGVGHHVAVEGPVGVEAGLTHRAVEFPLVGVALQVHLQRGRGHKVALALGTLVRLGPCNGVTEVNSHAWVDSGYKSGQAKILYSSLNPSWSK